MPDRIIPDSARTSLPELSDAQYHALGMTPLSVFSDDYRDYVNEQANAETPPPKWEDNEFTRFRSRGQFEWFIRRGRDIRQERITRAQRAEVIERDGLVCGLCGGVVERSDVHIDHRYPLSRGGLTTVDNLHVAHSRCNLSKGARVR